MSCSVSAPYLAAEMGLVVHEVREGEAEHFTNLLRVRYETETGAREVAGTVFGRSSPRFVMMDGFRFEVNPEGHLLVYTNVDRPGVLARVGSILSRHGVNIAGVSLGRAVAGGDALVVMNIDCPIPPDGLSELKSLQEVTNLRMVRID